MQGISDYITGLMGGESLHKRLSSYILKWVLGSFLLNDIKDQDFQLDRNDSKFKLFQLEIDPKAINELLPNLPFKFLSGKIDKLELSIPWRAIAQPSCVILSGLNVELELQQVETIIKEEFDLKSSIGESSLFMANSFIVEQGDEIPDIPEVKDSAEKASMISGWIESIVKMLKVCIYDVQISIKLPNNNNKIVLKVDSLICNEDLLLAANDIDKNPIARVFEVNELKLFFNSDLLLKGEGVLLKLIGLSDKESERTSSLFAKKFNNCTLEMELNSMELLISPKQAKEILCFIDNINEIINKNGVKNNEKENKEEVEDIYLKVFMEIKKINIQLFYLPQSFEAEFEATKHSHLRLFSEVIIVEFASVPRPPMVSIESIYEGSYRKDIQLNFNFQKLMIDEYLSYFENEAELLENQFSFQKDSYLPILYFDEELQSSTDYLIKLPVVTKDGKVNVDQDNIISSGIPSLYSNSLDSNNNSFSFDPDDYIDEVKFQLKIQLFLNLKNTCIIDGEPICLRVDPRMIDRFEYYYHMLMPFFVNNPSKEESDKYNNINFNTSNNNIFDDIYIMNDLDMRNNNSPKKKKNWEIELKSNFVRLIIFTPATVLGEDILLNHKIGRIHQDFWIMDILKPRIIYPKIINNNEEKEEISFKIDYHLLDISLYLRKENEIYCFLSISPMEGYEKLGLPNLDITLLSNENITERISSPIIINRNPNYFDTSLSPSTALPVPFPKVFQGFIEGEVKLLLKGYEEEVMEFKQKVLNFTKVIVSTHFQTILIKFDKLHYDRNQFLVNDISSYEPHFLKFKEMELEFEDSNSFFTAEEDYASKYRSTTFSNTEEKFDNEGNNLNLSSLLCLIVAMPHLDIQLDFKTGECDNSYTINFSECRFFSSSKFQGKNQTYCHIEADEFYLINDLEQKNPIISPTFLNHVKNNFSITFFSSLEPPLSHIKESSINISLKGLQLSLNHNEQWLVDFISFGNPDEKGLTPISNTLIRAKVSVNIDDLTCLFKSEEENLSFLFEQFKLSTTIFNPNPEIQIKAGIQSMKIMINNQLLIQKEKIPLRYRKAENHKFMYSSQFNNKKQSSIQLWKKQGFIQIGYLSYLSILVKIINSGNEVPHIDIQCDNQSFDIQLYKDSIQILTLLLEKITQKFNNNNNNNNHNDSDNDNNNSNSNNSSDYDDNEFIDGSHEIKESDIQIEANLDFNILDTIDNHAFEMPPNLPPRPETRNNNSYSTNETEIEINFNELLSPTNIDMDYFDHLNFNDKSDEEWENENCNYDNINNKNSMEKVKILDIEPFELVEDYFSTIQHNLNEMEDNLVCNYSMKLNVKEFNLNIQFFKGSCFDEIDQKECIEIQLNQFKLNYIQFIMGDIQSKFNIEVNEFNILDHFQKDKYQKFISFNKGFKDYIFNLELTSISLNDSNVEYRFSMDLLPLRLFINQNSILFLIQLFENENNSTISNETGRVSEDSMDNNNNNETTKLLNKIYFQYIKINEIQLIIDYQPKSIDLMNFKNGQYYEILNLFSFKEAQLKLLNIELNGIEGIDQLFENILNCWLPNIINHQLPTMIGGLKQIQPIYNLSNGIKDFIQLPLQQFKNEGKVLKGVKLGTYNLLKVTTFEALRFSSTIANSVHQILEGAGAALGAKNTNQQQNEQPNGLKEGFELGLKSFNRNLNNNNLIIGNHNNQELQQHNETNLVSTHALLQATPILLLKPMIGTAHLIALSLTGLKNSIKKK